MPLESRHQLISRQFHRPPRLQRSRLPRRSYIQRRSRTVWGAGPLVMEDDSNPINTLSPSRASPIGLRHLRYAVAAADHGNFRRAAEALLLWTNKLVDRIREHGLDLALLWGNALPSAMLVKRLPMVWIGPKGYVAKRGEEIPLALFEPPCVFRQPGINALERSGRRWRLALTSPSLTGLWATASAGLAITIRTTLGLRPAIGTTWAAK